MRLYHYTCAHSAARIRPGVDLLPNRSLQLNVDLVWLTDLAVPGGIGFYAVEGRVPRPQPNIWLGTSVENQEWADHRIPKLLETPAAVRFLSCEPLLGPVDLSEPLDRMEYVGDDGRAAWYRPALRWVIVGGESGPGARPMHPDWARSLRDQCVSAGVPFFFKQWGEWALADRATATHLLHVGGDLTPREHATMDFPYGRNSGTDQDLVDRGHAGWMRVRRAGKRAAGRQLDGRTWDEFPGVALEVA